jgi:hypothetical protein
MKEGNIWFHDGLGAYQNTPFSPKREARMRLSAIYVLSDLSKKVG